LIGWAAATGRVGAGGLVLAGILFVWQLPHFIAIALFRRFEYATAGLASLPLAKGDEVARRYAVAWTLVLVASTAGPVAIGMSGAVYAVAATVFGAGFLRRAVVGQQEPGWARRLFGGSLTYLTGLFVALGVDRWLC
jgi:protoheme IX farnesyltransferase